MNDSQSGAEEKVSGGRSRLIKFLLVAAALVVLLLAAQNPEIRAGLSQERLVAFVQSAGPWAPVLFILIYTVWVTALLPAIVPTLAGSVIFSSPILATIYIVLGATAGASTSFLLSRSAGRDLFARMLKGRIAALNEGIARNGFLVVFYARLLYAPFTYFNFAAGLTKVRFVHFFWATFLGIIPGTFILVFFVGRIKELALVARQASSRLEGLHEAGLMLITQPRYLVPLLIFIGSFFVPLIARRVQAGFAARKAAERTA